ncbi:MAG: N-acetylglucosaminyltransferase, partial [Oscillospiraceae bacterium]|nr:N-acetylglucosaminyltransferase [Oscillospiraceae bacterium]
MEIIGKIGSAAGLIIMLVCAYRFFYIPAVLILRGRRIRGANPRTGELRYAALICARNEAAVIPGIIGSLGSQTYGNVTVFVMADNCTDSTADIARSCGAFVYTRHST